MPFPGFNPRTRVGCDLSLWLALYRVSVSIHAPAWGATAAAINKFNYDAQFQSTHPRGVRHSP